MLIIIKIKLQIMVQTKLHQNYLNNNNKNKNKDINTYVMWAPPPILGDLTSTSATNYHNYSTRASTISGPTSNFILFCGFFVNKNCYLNII